MSDDGKTQHLSIYLVRKEITRKTHILRDLKYAKHLTLTLRKLGSADLYIRTGQRKYPKWISLFMGMVDPRDVGKVNSVAAVLLVKAIRRYFVLAFGPGGRFLVQESALESRFGLLVTLNSIDPQSLRCIDKQSLDSLESHSRVQSSHATSADQFGIDVEQDMLKAVVGVPSTTALGSRMTGADSLSVVVKANVNNLGLLVSEYYRQFERSLPKEYEWVNNIAGVKTSSNVIPQLEALLDGKLYRKDFSNIWLSIPEIIPWEQVKGFSYTSGGRVIHPDITMEGFLTTIGDEDVSIALLKKKKVYCADDDHRPIYNRWSVFRCLYAEIDFELAKYVLNNGKWFRVENDFVRRTNNEYSKIRRSGLGLPLCKFKNEGDYNQYIAASMPDDYALMDDRKRVFHGGGHGQVEVCDLFSMKKNLIHIKRYGKSSVLSHLIAQGFVSGRLIQLDAEFRKKFRSKLPSEFKPLVDTKSRPKDKEYTITFGIISDEPGTNLHLPFFSRVNLNNACRNLRGYGFSVELLKIGLEPDLSKTRIVPSMRLRRMT